MGQLASDGVNYLRSYEKNVLNLNWTLCDATPGVLETAGSIVNARRNDDYGYDTPSKTDPAIPTGGVAANVNDFSGHYVKREWGVGFTRTDYHCRQVKCKFGYEDIRLMRPVKRVTADTFVGDRSTESASTGGELFRNHESSAEGFDLSKHVTYTCLAPAHFNSFRRSTSCTAGKNSCAVKYLKQGLMYPILHVHSKLLETVYGLSAAAARAEV